MAIPPSYAFSISGQEFKLNRKYTPIKKIGEGAFGIVCAATDDATGERVAIKRIKPIFRDEWEARHTLREITIMRLCEQHPNVVCLRGLSLNEREDELYIVMECMFSDLHRIIKHVRPLNMGQVKVILKQILTGLEAMHAIGVIHRDLKPGNVLLTKECQVRISDFGLARFYKDVRGGGGGHAATLSTHSVDMGDNSDMDEAAVTMTQYVVTRWYRCPELLLAPHLPYNTAVDVWSIGCIFGEMLNGEALFPGSSNPDQVRRILRVLGTPKHHDFGFELHPEAVRFLKHEPDLPGVAWRSVCPQATDDALDLLAGLLTLDPRRRLTVREALDHPYLSDAPAAPGGSMELADFLESFERQGQRSLEFERKDASLEYLRRCIVREVDMINAPLIFGATGGGTLAGSIGEVRRKASRGGSDGVAQSKAAAEAETPRMGRGEVMAPPKRDGSGGRNGSIQRHVVKRAGSVEDGGKDEAAEKSGPTGAGEAEAKPTAKRSSFFKSRK